MNKNILRILMLTALIGLYNISSACTANFSYIIGANGHVSFTNTSTGILSPDPTYTWDYGDGSPRVWGYNANTSHIYIANNTYTVKLILVDSNFCTDSITIPVTVSNITTPCTLSAHDSLVIGNGQVTFISKSTGTNANTLYFWNFGDGSPRIQAHDTVTHAYTYANQYYYGWLIVEDTGSAYCIDSIQTYVYLNDADSNPCSMLHANFVYTISANGHVNFTSTSLGAQGRNLYYWNFGDGSPRDSSGSLNSHIYTVDGTYNVLMRIQKQDTVSCADSITIPITISNIGSEPCMLNAGFTITYDSSGQVTFTSTSTGTYANTEYLWNPGDGTGVTSGSSTFVHQYSFINSYNATLTLVTPGADSCTASITHLLYVYNKDSLQASFTYTPDTLASGTCYFTSTSKGTNPNTYYKWTPGDGDPADSGLGMSTYSHTYTSNGPYSASLSIWYTVLPLALNNQRVEMIHYDESTYVLVIHVNTATGIASLTDPSGNFMVYPNPNNGQFKLSLKGVPQNQIEQIDITNLLGEVIYSTKSQTSNNTLIKDIDMQSASAGIYFVRVLTNDKVYTAKLVIENK